MWGKSLKLTEDLDLSFVEGKLQLVTGATRTRQKLRIRLSTFLGEWFLDQRVGIPYFRDVLVKNPDEAIVRGIFADVITSTPEVLTLDRLDLDLSGRTLSLDFACTLTDGTSVALTFTEPILNTEA